MKQIINKKIISIIQILTFSCKVDFIKMHLRKKLFLYLNIYIFWKIHIPVNLIKNF